MDLKKEFKFLYKESIKTALKKSLFYSIFLSFSILFVTSLVFWIVNIKQYWILLIEFGVIELLFFVLLFIRIKPNEKKFAKELDSLGLEQRVITMYEYQNDDSLMAKIQRQNAVEHINKVNKKLIKFVAPVLLIVLTISIIILGIGSTTIATLSAKGIIKNGRDTIRQVVPGIIPEYSVSYGVKGEGTIVGDVIQTIKEGEDATAVIANPSDGYVFLTWSDGNKNPYRQDKAIFKNLDLYASFVTVDEYNELLKEPGTPTGPIISTNSEGNESGEGESDSDTNDARAQEQNQIEDGKTYYGDSTFDQYMQEMTDSLQQNGDLPSESSEIVNDYFNNIEK